MQQVRSIQPYRLQEELEEAGVTHGSHVEADVAGVPVIGVPEGEPQIAFCNMKPVTVGQVLEAGDGGPVPGEVEIRGFNLLRNGFHRLRNVDIETNGRIVMTATPRTEVLVG